MTRRIVMIALATALLAVTRITANEPVSEKLYAVIFGVIVDKKGQLVSFRVDKVMDPRSGSTAAVDVAVPETYVAAARALAAAKKYEPHLKDGKPVEFFTWFYFDPAQPTRADLDVDQKQ